MCQVSRAKCHVMQEHMVAKHIVPEGYPRKGTRELVTQKHGNT